MDRDAQFYERRIAEERAATLSASDPIVRERHRELAELYAEKLNGLAVVAELHSKPLLKVVWSKPLRETA